MEFKDRLREALKRRERSLRSLWLELKDSDVPGAAAYSSVHAYADGKTEPGLRWTEAAAKALNHRPEWIAFGTGERTPEDAAAARARQETTESDVHDEIFDKVHGIIGRVLAEFGLAEPARSVVHYYCFYGPAGGMGSVEHLAGRRGKAGYEDYEADYLENTESVVRSFVEGEFGATLKMREGDYQKFTAAVLAQASIVCLKHFPWGPWG